VTRQSNLIEDFAGNVRLIRRQTSGLGHADSLLQPPLPGNCLNWVLGHIVYTRMDMLQHLGALQFQPVDALARYAADTTPVLDDAADVVPLDRLLADLDGNQGDIAAYVDGLSEAALDQDVPFGERTLSREALLRFFLFHDTYHAGGLDWLRQLVVAHHEVLQ
jgi:hypothetical protein